VRVETTGLDLDAEYCLTVRPRVLPEGEFKAKIDVPIAAVPALQHVLSISTLTPL